MESKGIVSDGIFPLGEEILPAFRQYYSGPAYEQVLVPYDSCTGVTVAHVTFAPGSRNDWHSHPGGQLILVLSGKGWHQEAGKAPVMVRAGDRIEIGPNVRHWHGAAADSSYSYLAVKATATSGMPSWFGPVSDVEYGQLSDR